MLAGAFLLISEQICNYVLSEYDMKSNCQYFE